MKFPVSKHKEWLKNIQTYLENLEANLQRHQKLVDEQRKRIEFYQLQIETAEKQKKDGFDKNKFLRSKRQ